MVQYIIAFSFSTFFCGIANLAYKKSRFLFILFSFFSILIVSILAGVRDESIGTDIQVYGNIVFNLAHPYDSFFSYYNGVSSFFKLEPLYMWLNYFVSRFSHENAMFYFVLSFITIILFYLAINKLRDVINPTLAWISFLLIFYAHTLNIMRQSLATGFILLGFAFILKKSSKLGIIFLLLSFLCHYSSGVIGAMLYMIYLLLNRFKSPSKAALIFVGGAILVVLGLNPLINIFLTTGILADRYNFYTANVEGIGFSVFSFLLKLPIIALFVWRLYGKLRKDRLAIFFFVILIFDFLFYQLRITNIAFSRISYYFYVFQIVSIPYLIHTIKIKMDRNIVMIVYVLYLIVVWYYQVVVAGVNDIYPYSSEILNNFFSSF